MTNANAAFKQPSNRQVRFSKIPQANIPRSAFDLSHTHKGSIIEGGTLIPFDLYEVLPGDTFKINPTIFVRMTTQLTPIMDNMYLDYFYFFVPNRLLWANWQRFMGERDPDPASSIDYTIPQCVSSTNGFTAHSVADYFGIPPGIPSGGTLSVSALPFRAYNLIWNEWFRDQNIQDSADFVTTNGPDNATSYIILSRGKRHDYFTSCTAEPQKGTAVDLPLGESAPVTGIGKLSQVYSTTDRNVYETDGTGTVTYADNADTSSAGADNTFYVEQDPNNVGFPNIRADLTNATAATVNQLREAIQVQRLLERDARGGTRYFEVIQSHFGVMDPSSLVSTRPEFLGGDSTPFNQQTVAQTTFQGTETRFDGKGVLAANSIFVSQGNGITKSFTEHGFIMGIMNIRADITYQQGLDRHWRRSTRYDYYFPAFAHLGEQAVESFEIWADGTGSASADPPTGDYSIFGYQERFAEMRFGRNMITGRLRSDAASTLDYYHLAQDFSARPTLSSTFIADDPPVERTVNITPSTTAPAFIFDCYIKTIAVRPMPTYSVPGLGDRF